MAKPCSAQHEPKKSKKGPGDKPKRPLSAYNLFFRMERQKLLEEEKAAAIGFDISTYKQKHKIPKMAFGGLARYIADRWKNIDDETLAYYQGLAEKEQKRYMSDLVSWKIQEAHDRHGTYDDVVDNSKSSSKGEVTSAPAPQNSNLTNVTKAELAMRGWHVVPTLIYDSRIGAFVPVDILQSSETAGFFTGQPTAFFDSRSKNTQDPARAGNRDETLPRASFPETSVGNDRGRTNASSQFPLYADNANTRPSLPTRLANNEYTFFPSDGHSQEEEELVRNKGEGVMPSRWRHSEVPQQNQCNLDNRDGRDTRQEASRTTNTASGWGYPPMTPKDFEPLPAAFQDTPPSPSQQQQSQRRQVTAQRHFLFDSAELPLEPRNPSGGLVLDDDIQDFLISRLHTNPSSPR